MLEPEIKFQILKNFLYLGTFESKNSGEVEAHTCIPEKVNWDINECFHLEKSDELLQIVHLNYLERGSANTTLYFKYDKVKIVRFLKTRTPEDYFLSLNSHPNMQNLVRELEGLFKWFSDLGLTHYLSYISYREKINGV
jgi:hypothetical protein